MRAAAGVAVQVAVETGLHLLDRLEPGATPFDAPPRLWMGGLVGWGHNLPRALTLGRTRHQDWRGPGP